MRSPDVRSGGADHGFLALLALLALFPALFSITAHASAAAVVDGHYLLAAIWAVFFPVTVLVYPWIETDAGLIPAWVAVITLVIVFAMNHLLLAFEGSVGDELPEAPPLVRNSATRQLFRALGWSCCLLIAANVVKDALDADQLVIAIAQGVLFPLTALEYPFVPWAAALPDWSSETLPDGTSFLPQPIGMAAWVTMVLGWWLSKRRVIPIFPFYVHDSDD